MKIGLLPFLLVFSMQIIAQNNQETNTDVLLRQAAEAFRASDFQKSLEFTTRGLELAPDYHDIRILQIRNLWALQNYEAADRDLDHLLEKVPDYEGIKPLVLQRIDRFQTKKESLDFIYKIEKFYRQEIFIQVKKAQLLLDQKNHTGARSLAIDLVSRKELTSGERYTLETILRQTVTNEIGLNYQYIGFSEEYPDKEPWHSISGEYQHNFGRTPTIARVTWSGKGSREGILYEVEAYPVIHDKLYTFVNVGFSNGQIFPDLRGSLSVFYNFARVFEGEAGGRIQMFNDKSLFTGILGLSFYHQKFYFNARTFLGPEINEKIIQNYQGNIRYYFSGPQDYIYMRLGNGISPDERILSTHALENPLLKAYHGTLGINFNARVHHIFQVGAGVLYEDLSNDKKGNQVIGTAGYRYRF